MERTKEILGSWNGLEEATDWAQRMRVKKAKVIQFLSLVAWQKGGFINRNGKMEEEQFCEDLVKSRVRPLDSQ